METFLHLLFTTRPGQALLVVGVLALTALFWPPARYVLAPLWRLATGGLLFNRPGPWDSSWLYPAPDRPTERPAFRGEHYPRTRWGRMPGYQRMAARWAVVAYLLTLATYPAPTSWATVAVVVAIVARKILRVVQDWGVRRAAGLFVQGAAGLLGYGQRDPATWVAIPRPRLVWSPVAVPPRVLRLARRLPGIGDRLEHLLGALAVPTVRVPLEADGAQVRIAVDAEITNRGLIAEVAELALARLPEGPWRAEYRARELAIVVTHPKRPPASVWYTAEVNQQYAIDDVPIGQRAGAEWVTLPLKRLTPHVVASASTGWGKTTLANVYIAHTAGNGGKVLVNDPKRIGYLRAFGGLPNVSIKATVDGWTEHVDAFNAEMQRRYEIIEQHPDIADDPELYFQPWFLVTDERGSYVSEIRAAWKAAGEKGIPPTLRLEKINLWQARAAAMYIFDLAQQANLDVFLDSDGRDQRMARIAAGPQTRSSWMMLFPGVAKVKTLMRKGRAVLGIGPDSVEEIQLAQVSIEDARRFAEAGAVIADRENAERARRLSAIDAWVSRPSVPASDSAPSPGEIASGVPGQSAPGHSPELAHGIAARADLSVIPGDGDKSAGESVRPDLSVIENGTDNDLIVGLQAGADFLGMTLSNFEKSRGRRRIEGETRRGAQPAWSAGDLREWRAQAPRAGRSATGE